MFSHDLEGLKEAAYSIYTDIKQKTQFLVSESLKNIQDLDLFIDFQSIYFILPQYGSFHKSLFTRFDVQFHFGLF